MFNLVLPLRRQRNGLGTTATTVMQALGEGFTKTMGQTLPKATRTLRLLHRFMRGVHCLDLLGLSTMVFTGRCLMQRLC